MPSTEDFLKRQQALKLMLEGKSNKEIREETGLGGRVIGGLRRQLAANREAILRKYGLSKEQSTKGEPKHETRQPSISLNEEDIVRISSEVIKVIESKLGVNLSSLRMPKEAKEIQVDGKLPNRIVIQEVRGGGGVPPSPGGFTAREVEVDWSEVMRKSPITPSIYMWYVYSRSKGYDGTLRDWLDEVVNDYFEKVKGLRLGIIGEVGAVGKA